MESFIKLVLLQGGSDVIIRIINKYCHIPEGKAVVITNLLIICIGGFVFGISNVIYALIILYLGSNLIDRILIGISGSKIFFIHTKKQEKIKKFIIDELHTGVTLLETVGGYKKESSTMLMCVVPTRDYYLFKETILKLDPEAFFVIEDCYEVKGGVKRKNYHLK